MTAVIQCDNCGAVLAKEDLFCGECGVPRPVASEPEEALPNAAPTSDTITPPPAPPAAEPRTGWRVASVVSLVLGLLACVAGVLAFLLGGTLEYEGWGTTENWLFAAFCCLLPIGGAGIVLIAVGAAVWFKRLRNA
jgi:hypothetical protein